MVLNLTVEEVKKVIDANINGDERYQVLIEESIAGGHVVSLYSNGVYHKVNLDETALNEVIQHRPTEVEARRQLTEGRFLGELREFIELL